ncbi:lantibiotic dehydratase, partial [Archangium violaceum]
MTVPTPNGFVPSGFFALRTPLLPFDELLAWSEGLSAREAARQGDMDRLEAALAEDRALLRARLQAALARPEIREALFLASPSLDESHDSWKQAPGSERGQKVERALVRYWFRLAGRATPFGLFAGCSVGHLGETTRFALTGRQRYQRHARLDMDYVCTLAERLAALPELREALLYRPNTSLYRAGGRLRYAESRLQGRARTYHLVAVEPTDYLEATLDRARSGASPRALAQALADADSDVSLEEAEAYVAELISSQLLVPELAPAVTGPEPIHDLLTQLRSLAPAAGVHQRLEQARRVLEELNQHPPGVDPERYRALARGLEALPAPVELSRMFQVDMVKPAHELKLGTGPVEELTRAVRLLHRLHPAQEPLHLRHFREAFQQRYGEREVPLVEVLDEEAGIGFDQTDVPTAEASPLLEGLAFPAPAAEERVAWGARQQHLQRRLAETLRTGARELVLDERDLKALESKDSPPPLPDSFAVMATLLAPSEEAVGAGDFQVLIDAVVGPSGANLLGRFCHADPELHRHVEAHLRAEEALRPDVIHAEVVHQPEGRVGNILSRPVLRGHELVFLGRSGAEPERQLPITDLRVSVRGRRIVLRSERLGREVLPRLTNAHNFARAHLRLYRFLATLQQQGTTGGMKWRWGALETSPFLPRVVAGRVILQRARWRLPAKALEALGEVHEGARFQAVQRLRDELGLPRFVGVTDADNVLPVDLDNVLSVETFVHLVKDRDHAELVEFPDEARCAHGPEGRFVNELVVPFVRTDRPAAAEPRPRSASLPRSFAPGSEWLYAKLYTGTATADRVLCEAVAPLMREALASGDADHGFFIRYGDPDWHVRLRLHG